MEDHSLCPAYGSYLTDGLDGPDLVVGIHDGDKSRILSYCGLHFLRPYKPVLMNIKKRYLIALFFKLLQCVEYCMMFKGR